MSKTDFTAPLTWDEVSAAEQILQARGSISFASKLNRDQVWKAVSHTRFRRSSIKNQLVDRHYIYDEFADDMGLANVKRMYPTIYKIESNSRW